MTEDLEITSMQDEYFVSWRHLTRWTIVAEADGTFSVHEHTTDGVAPPTSYVTAEEAAARLLQIMHITKPVVPQDWPEDICVGHVDTSDHRRINL